LNPSRILAASVPFNSYRTLCHYPLVDMYGEKSDYSDGPPPYSSRSDYVRGEGSSHRQTSWQNTGRFRRLMSHFGSLFPSRRIAPTCPSRVTNTEADQAPTSPSFPEKEFKNPSISSFSGSAATLNGSHSSIDNEKPPYTTSTDTFDQTSTGLSQRKDVSAPANEKSAKGQMGHSTSDEDTSSNESFGTKL
jgi:hypothetical protein